MINSLFIFIVALFFVIRGATLSTKYATALAESFRLSPYTVGFIIVSAISILPETFISLNSALNGIPEFGLGTLFGSNIADLTLIFAIIILISQHNLKIETKILKNRFIYPILLSLPLILGFDGFFSRIEGVALILAGSVFYYLALRDTTVTTDAVHTPKKERFRMAMLLLLSMALLLVGAHFTVTSATAIAQSLSISPILIGMLVVGLGTTMPELFFSLSSVTKKHDSLAVGDLLGTVLADATIVVGILAVVAPFAFPKKIIFVTGAFMVAASLILFHFMRSGKTLTRREAIALACFWLVFVITEFLVNQ